MSAPCHCNTNKPMTLLFGGSFNPPHIGHMRIAIETAEVVTPCRTLFIPCSIPPHKSSSSLLPFSLRVELLNAALSNMRLFRRVTGQGQDLVGPFEVCEVEAEREGPSYTIDTLEILAKRYPETRLAFLMGSGDYERFSSWTRWQDFPAVADIIVLPRDGSPESFFKDVTSVLWPDAEPIEPPYPGVTESYRLPCGGRLLQIPQPRLEISATLIRERYLAGRSLDFLVPPNVEVLLRAYSQQICEHWGRCSL